MGQCILVGSHFFRYFVVVYKLEMGPPPMDTSVLVCLQKCFRYADTTAFRKVGQVAAMIRQVKVTVGVQADWQDRDHLQPDLVFRRCTTA